MFPLFNPDKYEEVCMSLKEKGGKTSQQLQQEQAQKYEDERKELAKKVEISCIICFELKEDNMKIIPCAKTHFEWLCTDCLARVRKEGNKCPLCREQLIEIADNV